MSTRHALIAGALFAIALVAPGCARSDNPAATAIPANEAADIRFHFGTVVQGTPVAHQFPLRNQGAQPLRIAGVQLSPPLQLAKMPAVIPPGETGLLKLTLDTSLIEGEYQGQLLVMLADAAEAPRAFSVEGKVTPPIEILPHAAFFLSTAKGTEKSGSVEIVNHEARPLALTLDPAALAEYKPRLEVLEPGRRFRLTVTVPASAPAGRHSSRLALQSSSPGKPTLYVGLNTIVRERVHTFPDTVDFGQLRMRDLAQGPNAAGAQTLMVYQTGGKAFSATPRSTIAGMALAAEPGPQGDRVQITATLGHEVVPGPITGTITVQTNDPEFPQLQVPVTGEIVAD